LEGKADARISSSMRDMVRNLFTSCAGASAGSSPFAPYDFPLQLRDGSLQLFHQAGAPATTKFPY
jgi:hypothetical protein